MEDATATVHVLRWSQSRIHRQRFASLGEPFDVGLLLDNMHYIFLVAPPIERDVILKKVLQLWYSTAYICN